MIYNSIMAGYNSAMIERYNFTKAYLDIGQHKTIRTTSVFLEIQTWVEDEYGTPNTEKRSDYNEDGVRARGEFSFDEYPITDLKHPVKRNAMGTLTLMDGEESSKFNILIVERNCDHTILKDRIKRYFWMFYVIGRPIYDRLELYPKWLREKSMNRVFVCTDFRGIWPVGVSSMVVARSPLEAKNLLISALEDAGINQPEMNDLTLQEVDLNRSQAVILNAGNY